MNRNTRVNHCSVLFDQQFTVRPIVSTRTYRDLFGVFSVALVDHHQEDAVQGQNVVLLPVPAVATTEMTRHRCPCMQRMPSAKRIPHPACILPRHRCLSCHGLHHHWHTQTTAERPCNKKSRDQNLSHQHTHGFFTRLDVLRGQIVLG